MAQNDSMTLSGLLGAFHLVYVGKWELKEIQDGCGGFVLGCALDWASFGHLRPYWSTSVASWCLQLDWLVLTCSWVWGFCTVF